LKEVRIYFEGDKKLRRGFNGFFNCVFERARSGRIRISFIAGGATPVKDFCTALGKHPDASNCLLIDSEKPFADTCFDRLIERDDWNPPGKSSQYKEDVLWMVQIMESWFLADKDTLESYYGNNFNRNTLPQNSRIEDIPKGDVLDGLKETTRETQKRKYHKTNHAPDILAKIDPSKVKEASPNCVRIFDVLLQKIESFTNE